MGDVVEFTPGPLLYDAEVYTIRFRPGFVLPPAMPHAAKFKLVDNDTYSADLDTDELEEVCQFLKIPFERKMVFNEG